MTGKVFLIGAGPGDPGLITVKGLRLLQAADVVLYDRLVAEALLREAKPTAKLIYCGKTPHGHCQAQRTINDLLVKYAGLYETVVRLKGGDPFIFGRGGEEALALVKHHIAFEIVPGVTAGIAAPAYAGIPVTFRDQARSVTFVTAHQRVGSQDRINWSKLVEAADTLAIYMGVSVLPQLATQLVAAGLAPETPAAVIEWGTTEHQRTCIAPLSRIAQLAKSKCIKSPAMIVIGETVKLSEQLQWFHSLDRHDMALRRVF
ncbi:MAG: uroporphyrinogen-III C-methyltransferase [Sporolactobacillus sp.]|jgi:uroporphyrin-III C-methyltransferase|nr:uroporphyrinogen-III C-methyltransferase [Sporolactobacillus sp.]